MTQYLQWLIPALALIAVGALSLIGAWHAPVRNDRAVALQELELVKNLKEVGRPEAAEKVIAVVEARIQDWRWTTMFHFCFVRLAFRTAFVGAWCVVGAVLLYGATETLWPVQNYETTNVFKTTELLYALASVCLVMAIGLAVVAAYFITPAAKEQGWKGPQGSRARGRGCCTRTGPSGCTCTGPGGCTCTGPGGCTCTGPGTTNWLICSLATPRPQPGQSPGSGPAPGAGILGVAAAI